MLADQLRQARERAGLSGYALAQQSGIGVATIAEIESGEDKDRGILTVAKLADVLQVSLDALTERTTTPRPRRKRPAPAADGEEEAAA